MRRRAEIRRAAKCFATPERKGIALAAAGSYRGENSLLIASNTLFSLAELEYLFDLDSSAGAAFARIAWWLLEVHAGLLLFLSLTGAFDVSWAPPNRCEARL